jgi:hypothetical protein
MTLTPRVDRWDISVPLSRTRIPVNCCAGSTVQRPCQRGIRWRFDAALRR